MIRRFRWLWKKTDQPSDWPITPVFEPRQRGAESEHADETENFAGCLHCGRFRIFVEDNEIDRTQQ
ncbi:MAG: hypothetical protein A2664_02935 [Candidatus Taylorbacteria bacterium RIFCSPHIGHO2_01_FULL_46_22b]|uniref:Uncharacterized protein n=1 Tax=Candidatus Taylorbacteria bacterium RIFCSPHIGHO2_01_FULL_46_22b TaxID=1802301 RepID=A0A1G2M3X3_9BACT|nr:MAG: hypothetical protein A2664_02935 [Candidatus Taylorbacteria bacterium RIFCSPHIGHO2_01_FULL_46_22b]